MNETVGFQVTAKNSLDPWLERHRASPLAEHTLPKRAPNRAGEAEEWGRSEKGILGEKSLKEELPWAPGCP